MSDMHDVFNMVIDSIRDLKTSFWREGIVADIAEDGVSEYIGAGAIKIYSPRAGINSTDEFWASPFFNIRGRFEYPEVGETVWFARVNQGTFPVYVMGGFYDRIDMADPSLNLTRVIGSSEVTVPLGFVEGPGPTAPHFGGKYMDTTLKGKGKKRILESSEFFVFFEDKEDKELHLRGADSYKMRFQTGDGGQLIFEAADEINDDSTMISAEFLFKPGMSGKVSFDLEGSSFEVTSGSGGVKFETSQGNMVFTSSMGDFDADIGSGKFKFANTSTNMKTILDDLVTAILNATFPTSMGPTQSPPINQSEFEAVKTKIGNLFL